MLFEEKVFRGFVYLAVMCVQRVDITGLPFCTHNKGDEYVVCHKTHFNHCAES